MDTAPARYFPIRTRAQRLRPGLAPFGTDFGNGAADRLHFQRDDERERTLAARFEALRPGRPPPVERHRVVDDGPESAAAHHAVLAWIEQTLDAEGAGQAPPSEVPITSRYDGFARRVQEDLVVVQRDGGSDRAIMVHVCFPSRWRPEQISGWSFGRIHGPVPGFADDASAARRMVATMIDRGPFVRFVWTVCADDHLDHHPEEGLRIPWSEGCKRGWLRVERQLTIPFPAVESSLFLIRTYLYPFTSLTPGQRGVLATALARMPEDVARYKGLLESRRHPIALLQNGADG